MLTRAKIQMLQAAQNSEVLNYFRKICAMTVKLKAWPTAGFATSSPVSLPSLASLKRKSDQIKTLGHRIRELSPKGTNLFHSIGHKIACQLLQNTVLLGL